MKPFGWTWFRVSVAAVVMVVVCGIAIWGSWDLRGTSAIWLTAFAALLASFVSLFGERVKQWLWRPDLRIDYVHGPDYCDTPIMQGVSGGAPVAAECYYFRLRVSNVGSARANMVEVHVSDLQKQQANGNFTQLRRYSMNLKWTNIGTSQLTGLSPRMERFCDLGHVADPAMRARFPGEDLPGVAHGTAILALDLETQPFHGTHLLEPGNYRLSIRLVAENHKPVHKLIEIEVTGFWAPNNLPVMLRQGIRIQIRR